MGEGLFASDGTDHQHFTYQQDAIGNITTQSGKGTYRYDASGSCTPDSSGGSVREGRFKSSLIQAWERPPA